MGGVWCLEVALCVFNFQARVVCQLQEHGNQVGSTGRWPVAGVYTSPHG